MAERTSSSNQSGGSRGKKSSLTDNSRLHDANNAGTALGEDCTLVLAEDDVATSVAISGLSVVGRDYYGVFPLKGKLLDVREAIYSQVLENEKIQNLVQAMGLKFGQTYDSTKSLRYGHLLIMSSRDDDGTPTMKDLATNIIRQYWPSLLGIDGFLQEFLAPVAKYTDAQMAPTFFYTMAAFVAWRKENTDGQWCENIKHYVGLGTCSIAEAKELFYKQATEVRFRSLTEAKEYFVKLTAGLRRKGGCDATKPKRTRISNVEETESSQPPIAASAEKPQVTVKRKESQSVRKSFRVTKKQKKSTEVESEADGVS